MRRATVERDEDVRPACVSCSASGRDVRRRAGARVAAADFVDLVLDAREDVLPLLPLAVAVRVPLRVEALRDGDVVRDEAVFRAEPVVDLAAVLRPVVRERVVFDGDDAFRVEAARVERDDVADRALRPLADVLLLVRVEAARAGVLAVVRVAVLPVVVLRRVLPLAAALRVEPRVVARDAVVILVFAEEVAALRPRAGAAFAVRVVVRDVLAAARDGAAFLRVVLALDRDGLAAAALRVVRVFAVPVAAFVLPEAVLDPVAARRVVPLRDAVPVRRPPPRTAMAFARFGLSVVSSVLMFSTFCFGLCREESLPGLAYLIASPTNGTDSVVDVRSARRSS